MLHLCSMLGVLILIPNYLLLLMRPHIVSAAERS